MFVSQSLTHVSLSLGVLVSVSLQSAVCSLQSAVCGLQSAVCSLQMSDTGRSRGAGAANPVSYSMRLQGILALPLEVLHLNKLKVE